MGENLQKLNKTWFESTDWVPLVPFDFAASHAKRIKIQMDQNWNMHKVWRSLCSDAPSTCIQTVLWSSDL